MADSKLKSGKWQASISYRDNEDISRKKKRSFKTRREAIDFETDFLRSLKDDNDHEQLTYQEVIDQYEKWNSINANTRSVMDNMYLINKLTDGLRNKVFISLTRSDFTKIYIEISNESKWGVVRKNRALKQLKAVSSFADKHLNLNNNTKHLENFKSTSDDLKDHSVWTHSQLIIFMDEVEDYTMKTLFWFQFYTGARIGETRALLKEDLIQGKVSINKSIRSFKEGFKPLKNTSSKRTITLDGETLSKLQPLLATSGSFLFGGLEPISENMVQRTFKKALKSADVPIIKVHDLRHSHATLLINRGANIVAVSKRLGHENIQTTLKTYTHLLQESDDELIKILSSESTTKVPQKN